MQRNNPVKMALTLRKKITLIIFGLFLFLALLESGLRLGGFILLLMQEHRNLQSIKQKGAYRIMCLGESTTQGQYPRFLEQVLNQRNIGVSFSVIDKGIKGSDTPAILSQVESYLNEYHPEMVVAMMGVNDREEQIPREATATSKVMLYIRSFRTYKFARLLWLHIQAKAKEAGFYKLKQDRGNFKKVQTYLPKIGLKEAPAEFISTEASLKKAIELNPKDDHAYVGLGWIYRVQGKISQAEASLKKAIELNPKDDNAYVGLGQFYRNQGKISQAEDVFKKAMKLNPRGDRVYGAISVLYEEIGKPELAKEYAKNVNRLRSEYYNSVTVNSYRKLKEILDRKGIRLVCVQYPMRNLESLKNMFEQDEGIIFVDNERVFKEVLKISSHKDYFRDMFGGDFGHCTKKGNRLLAENIADTILRKVFHK